jgi:hypothetical protein
MSLGLILPLREYVWEDQSKSFWPGNTARPLLFFLSLSSLLFPPSSSLFSLSSFLFPLSLSLPPLPSFLFSLFSFRVPSYPVIWLQGGIAFAVWIAYGVFQNRRSDAIRAQVDSIPRSRRGLLAAALFVVAAMVLLGGLGLVLQRGGFTPQGMTPLAWGIVTLLGLAFVHAQTMATAMLVTLIQGSVTNKPDATSINRAPEGLKRK